MPTSTKLSTNQFPVPGVDAGGGRILEVGIPVQVM